MKICLYFCLIFTVHSLTTFSLGLADIFSPVAVGNGVIRVSTDGINWLRSYSGSKRFFFVTYGGGRVIAIENTSIWTVELPP